MLNGILSGNTRADMMKKMEQIIEFSELGDFIYQPLRTYSSGMHARLGFSVAVHIDPEILLVDEALAVGDLDFKGKCNRKMKEFMESGATIIIVSHDMPAIAELCNRVAWIDSGTIMKIGSPREVIREYLHSLGIVLDEEEDELLSESEIETMAADKNDTIQDFGDVSALDAELPDSRDAVDAIAQDMISPAVPVPSSWWDSPIIMHQCETFITGDAGVHFYEFLKREFSIADLQKGLSICNRLKGIEGNFMKYGTCKSFDVVKAPHDVMHFQKEPWEFRRNFYDFLLCVDFLNRLHDLDMFLKNVETSLKDDGFIVAMEYIGPAQFIRRHKELEIADMIYKGILQEDTYREDIFSNIGIRKASIPKHIEPNSSTNAISSDSLITLIGKFFVIIGIRYFGGPLYDLVLNRILYRINPGNEKDLSLIRTVVNFDQILTKENILNNNYAVIIGKKRSSHIE
jgi:hypothetical protein